MTGIVRAAGFAAAALGAACFPAFASPSQALNPTSPPPPAIYTDHASALTALSPDQSSAAAEQIATVQDLQQTTPVASHAVAPVAPELAEPEQATEPEEKRSLLALVDEYASTEAADAELECLAGAIYFESKGEPLAGQLAVAEVILNRTKSGRYPTTACGVVKQRGQFSFVRGGRLPPIPKSSAPWRKAVAIAHIALKDLADSPAEDALSFHATYVSPGWKMKRVARVGNHIFYR